MRQNTTINYFVQYVEIYKHFHNLWRLSILNDEVKAFRKCMSTLFTFCFPTVLRILLIYFYFHLTVFIKNHCTYLNRSHVFVIALINAKSCWQGERKKEFTVTRTLFDSFLKVTLQLSVQLADFRAGENTRKNYVHHQKTCFKIE